MIALSPWVVGLVVGLANIVITVSVMIWRFSARFAVLEEKVDTIWAFLIKRAMTEALVKGWVVKESPIRPTEIAREAVQPIWPDIQHFYDQGACHLSYADLILAIDSQFGPWIVEHICVPHNLTSGACLVAIAALLGKEPEPPPAQDRRADLALLTGDR